MATSPYMPLYIGDYLSDTAHLSTEEHGAYLLLIMAYWQSGKPLPNSNERLANVARMSSERWASVRAELQRFFNDDGTHWIHKRIEEELDKYRSKSEKAQKAGFASAEARKANGRYNERSTDAQRTCNQSESESSLESESIRESDTKAELKALQRSAAKKPAASAATIDARRSTWEAYKIAYEKSYKIAPVGNASVYSQVKQLVERIGCEDAPALAGWFLTHRNSWYIQKGHSIASLLADCEKLRTEMKAGVKIHKRDAAEADRIAANTAMYDRIGANYEAMKAKKETEGEFSIRNL